MYLDIHPIESGFLTNGAGDLLLKDRAVDIASDVILADKGSFKYAPLCGGEANRFLNSNASASIIQRAFKVALKTAGFSKPTVDVSNFPESIEINNNEIL
jgi:hypothetical protein